MPRHQKAAPPPVPLPPKLPNEPPPARSAGLVREGLPNATHGPGGGDGGCPCRGAVAGLLVLTPDLMWCCGSRPNVAGRPVALLMEGSSRLVTAPRSLPWLPRGGGPDPSTVPPRQHATSETAASGISIRNFAKCSATFWGDFESSSFARLYGRSIKIGKACRSIRDHSPRPATGAAGGLV